MYEAAQKNAIHALAIERQVFGIALDQFELGMFFAAEQDKFGADVEADTGVAGVPQQFGEHPRATAAINRAFDFGVKASYSSLAACASKKAISFCLS